MSVNMSISSRSNSPPLPPEAGAPSYPVPAYLNFTPGGLSYRTTDSQRHWCDLASYSTPPALPHSPRRRKTPEVILLQAKRADDVLRRYTLLYAQSTDAQHFLPSLSALASAAFDRLSGVPHTSTRRWADAMVAAGLPLNG